MSARDLLHRALQARVQITVDRGELVLTGDPDAVDALVPEVRARKAQLLSELARSNVSGPLPKALERRIVFVGKHHGFTDEQLAEAKEIAAGDVDGATLCFGELHAEILAGREIH